jgi:hypothetical protein
MILSGSPVQMNGFAAVLQLSRKRLMAAWRSATERRTALKWWLGERGVLDGIQPGA